MLNLFKKISLLFMMLCIVTSCQQTKKTATTKKDSSLWKIKYQPWEDNRHSHAYTNIVSNECGTLLQGTVVKREDGKDVSWTGVTASVDEKNINFVFGSSNPCSTGSRRANHTVYIYLYDEPSSYHIAPKDGYYVGEKECICEKGKQQDVFPISLDMLQAKFGERESYFFGLVVAPFPGQAHCGSPGEQTRGGAHLLMEPTHYGELKNSKGTPYFPQHDEDERPLFDNGHFISYIILTKK